MKNQRSRARQTAFIVLTAMGVTCASGGEKLIIQLRDFTKTEMRGAGFSLPSSTRLHIAALGGGEKSIPSSSVDMYSYGWIINADTRSLVWKMDRENTTRSNDDRKFDDWISLPRGSYELYFAAYGYTSHSKFSNFTINIDPREKNLPEDKQKMRNLLQWLESLFGEDITMDWKKRAKNWGLDLSVDELSNDIVLFNVPKEFPRVVWKSTRLGENEHIRQRFTVSSPIKLRIYALGEKGTSTDLVDGGWIINPRTHKSVWEMQESSLKAAGGADKNVMFDEVIPLTTGDYILYYVTDGSHSFVDWNAPPPWDPYNYGVTLIAHTERDAHEIKLISAEAEDQNVIAQLVRVGNDETLNASFSLKQECTLRIYAIGEMSLSGHQLADYGWIVNAQTREKVWTMDPDRTQAAGGASKNRMVDDIITLPKGTYTIFYQTDDSHAYNEWNGAPPFDPEHYGITVSGEGENFSMANVEKNVSAREKGVIAQLVQVGDNANLSQRFQLDRSTKVRIYALGEGQNREMYDYGWIENASTGSVIWEMTYSMTFHAGGGRKNRSVSTTLILEKGEYILHYVSDDSHSFNHWNTDPPDDPTMWGITLSREE
jgi:hypothetical protein